MAARAQLARQAPGEVDRVALHHHVQVEALLPEQHVAHRAADQVHAVLGRRRSGDRGQHVLQPLDGVEALPHRGGRLGVRQRPLERRRLVQGAQQVPARDDAVGARDRDPVLGPVRALVHDHEPVGAAGRKQLAQLAERRVGADHVDARAHHALHRCVAEPVAHRTVEVLARDDAGQVTASETWMPLRPSRWHSTSVAEMSSSLATA